MKNQLLAACLVACLAVALTLPDASPAKTAKKNQQGSSAKKSPPPPPAKKTGANKGPTASPPPAPVPTTPPTPAASGTLNPNFTAPVARLPGVISAMQMRPAAVADQEACLFQNANFTGWKFCTNLTSLQVLPAPYQRQLTSIKIPDGYLLRFYPTPNRSGWSCVFYGQVEKVSDECDNVANAISFEPDPEWPAKQAEAERQAQEQQRIADTAAHQAVREQRANRAWELRRSRERVVNSAMEAWRSGVGRPLPKDFSFVEEEQHVLRRIAEDTINTVVFGSSDTTAGRENSQSANPKTIPTLTDGWNDDIEVVTIAYPETKVILYENENFQGRHITLTCGQWELTGEPRNAVSSSEIEYHRSAIRDPCLPGVQIVTEWER